LDPQGAAAGDGAGVNVTASVQEPAAGTPAVQLFTAVKLPGGFTVAVPTLKIAAAAPLLVIVTVTGADAVPASAPPKLIVPVGEIVALACTAVPLTASICGLFGALSESITTAERAPVCVGSNVTFMTQDLPPASGLCEQLSVSAKSLGFVPAVLMVMATGVVPVLLTVTTCAALFAPTVCDAKFKVAGDSEIPEVPPVPLSATLCGLPAALSEMLSVALTDPAACGTKSTEMVQLAPAINVPLGNGHGVAPFTKNPKLVEALPVIAMPVKFSSALPAFVSVTVCVPLVLPTGCVPNDSDAGKTVKIGATPVPVPLTVTTCCDPVRNPELSTNPTSVLMSPVVAG
jgi:hypothetical protein